MQNMKENKKIKLINYYACGYCVNNLKYIVKGNNQNKKFYAGVFLIKHEKYGYILFDTGYSREIYKCGMIGKLYNLLNPTFIKFDEEIIKQLKQDGIDADDIKYVILSHLHPDHIGGIKFFKNAKFIISSDCMEEYKNSKFKSLIIKKFFSENFEQKVMIINNFNETYIFFDGHDLFSDKSMILTVINGHFKGQMCLYMPEHKIFLGADICWGLKFQDNVNEMSFFARLVQNNFNEYKEGIKLMKKLEEGNIRICLSHDDYDSKELI